MEAEREKERERAREKELSHPETVYLDPANSPVLARSSSLPLGFHDNLPIIKGQFQAMSLLWRRSGFFSLWKGILAIFFFFVVFFFVFFFWSSPSPLPPPSLFRQYPGDLTADWGDDHPADGGERPE